MKNGSYYEYIGETLRYPRGGGFPIWFVKGKSYKMEENGLFRDGNGDLRKVPLDQFNNLNNY